jgi:hypothetical protein
MLWAAAQSHDPNQTDETEMTEYKIRYLSRTDDGYEETRKIEITAPDRDTAIAMVREQDQGFIVVNSLTRADADTLEAPKKRNFGQILFLMMSGLMALGFIGSSFLK